MNYYDEIDLIGEEQPHTCRYCGVPCGSAYCSDECHKADLL